MRGIEPKGRVFAGTLLPFPLEASAQMHVRCAA